MDNRTGDRPAMTGGLWLTSAEQWFWDRPRRVELVAVTPGPEAGSQYARLHVPAEEPDGPMDLLATRRDGGPWQPLAPDDAVPVAVWTVDDVAAVFAGAVVRPPTPRPTAWCTVTATRDRAVVVAASAGGGR